jgi:hemolysin activation/secretion protein
MGIVILNIYPNPVMAQTSGVGAESPASDSTTVKIDSVLFSGNNSISGKRLTAVLKPWLHRQLGLAEMDRMAAAVTAYYRDHGFMVAQAYFKPQPVAAGAVELTVVEGRFSDIEVRSNRSAVSSRQILRTAMANACNRSSCTGIGPLLRDDVERAGLLVSEIPGVSATYQLEAGKEPGSTSMLLDVKPTKRFSGSVSLDNEGFAYTGRDRLTVAASGADLIGIGDLTAVTGTYSGNGLFSLSGDASVPVGYRGDRVGLTLSHLKYALGLDFAALDASGLAQTAGLYLTHPLHRTLVSSLDLRLDLQARKTEGDIGATALQSRGAVREAILALSGSRLDHWLKSGSTQFRLAYAVGDLRLQDEPSRVFDTATANTAGGFGKLTYMARREELITSWWTVFGSVNGQWTAKNLDPSEKFGLVGPTAVRAYAPGGVSADDATVLTVETRFAVPQDLTHGAQVAVAPFYDRGWATYNANPWASYAGPLRGTFAGGGVYVSAVWPQRYSLRATWAVRDGDQPAPAHDAGSQFWLEAASAF